MTIASHPRRSDPVIEAYKKDVDRTLLRENLTLSVEERILKLVAMLEVKRATERPKDLEEDAKLEAFLDERGDDRSEA